MSITQNIMIIVVVLFMQGAYADTHHFPHGCHKRGYQFKDNKLILKQSPKKNQTLFFIYNPTKHDVNIRISKEGLKPYHPDYRKTLYFGRWGSFAMRGASLNFSCYDPSTTELNGHQISCKHALRLCQFTNAVFDGSNRGTYWVKVNQNLRGVMNEAVSKGIYLKR